MDFLPKQWLSESSPAAADEGSGVESPTAWFVLPVSPVAPFEYGEGKDVEEDLDGEGLDVHGVGEEWREGELLPRSYRDAELSRRRQSQLRVGVHRQQRQRK